MSWVRVPPATPGKKAEQHNAPLFSCSYLWFSGISQLSSWMPTCSVPCSYLWFSGISQPHQEKTIPFLQKKLFFFLQFRYNHTTFASFFCRCPLSGGTEGKNLYIEKAFLYALSLTSWNLAVPNNVCQRQSNKDALWICLVRLTKPSTCISAWASALLVSTNKRCQSFRKWDEQQEGSHAFFIYKE